MIARVLTLIRFSHTIFAMPFALGAMLVAARGLPPFRIIFLIVIAMIFARTAAMLFNRVVDWELDQRNPRTASRHQLVPRRIAIAFLFVSAIAFVATAFFINPLCAWLAPVALAIVFFYSLTKRFTHLSHFFLGLALAVSPVGAWLAVCGRFDLPPLILAAGVVLWVAGFDLIYATQDVEFDRETGLHSLVVRLGVARALRLAQWLHAGMWLLLCAFGFVAALGGYFAAGLVLILFALLYEHRVARKGDLHAINRAFFNVNAMVGVIFIAAVASDLLLRR